MSKTFNEKVFSFHFRRVKFLLLPTLTEKIVVLTKLNSSGNLHSYEKKVNQFFRENLTWIPMHGLVNYLHIVRSIRNAELKKLIFLVCSIKEKKLIVRTLELQKITNIKSKTFWVRLILASFSRTFKEKHVIVKGLRKPYAD